MSRFGQFLRTTFLGGFIVLLPVVLTLYLLRWLVDLITQAIQPVTAVFTEHARFGQALAFSLAFIGVITVCFVLGLVVKTRLGAAVLRGFEHRILKEAPGYSFFKETVRQLLGQKDRSFSKVVLVRMFNSSALSIGFITNEDIKSGLYSVFVPSGLNPTSGHLLHVLRDDLVFLDVSVETAMRTIIGCGTGASALLEGLSPKTKLDPAGKR